MQDDGDKRPESRDTELQSPISTQLKRRLEEEIARLEKVVAQTYADVEKKHSKLLDAKSELTALKIEWCLKRSEIDVLNAKLATREKECAEFEADIAKQEKALKLAARQHSKVHDAEIGMCVEMIEHSKLCFVPRQVAHVDIDDYQAETEAERAGIADELSKCTAEMDELSMEREKTKVALEEISFHDIKPEVTKEIGASIDRAVTTIRRTLIDLKLKNRTLRTQK